MIRLTRQEEVRSNVLYLRRRVGRRIGRTKSDLKERTDGIAGVKVVVIRKLENMLKRSSGYLSTPYSTSCEQS